MPTRILLSAPYMIPQYERFKPIFDELGMLVVMPKVVERLAEQQLLSIVGDIDGAICGDDEFTARVLERAAPRLKVISKWGTGVDSIDRDAAQRLGIQVRNTPGAFTDAVADSVMGYILTFARRLHDLDDAVKSGEWSKLAARALNECTLGVVGVGRIGRAVLSRGKAFGARLLGTDIVEVDREFVEYVGAQVVPLAELLAASDFVSLNCDLNPSSRHLINAQALALMQEGAVLINTARGAIVDEHALIEALKSGRLGGAALDVFEEEPLPADSPLRGFDNVLLGAHNANSSLTAWDRVHRNTIRNLFLGLGLPTPKALGEFSGP